MATIAAGVLANPEVAKEASSTVKTALKWIIGGIILLVIIIIFAVKEGFVSAPKYSGGVSSADDGQNPRN